MAHTLLNFLPAILLCYSTLLHAEVQIPIDQIPMYGNIDRNAVPELNASDEKLIADTTKHYETRAQASSAFVNRGFEYYQQDDLINAMRRFNQAWILNPDNPEVYAGFGSVQHDKGENCEAMKMMEKAIALNPPTFQGIYPDAARLISLCAVSNKNLTIEARKQLIERSDALYTKAEELERNKQYVYGSWASAYYWREQYYEAWTMITKQRNAGGSPGKKFLELLREKMPEPASANQ